MQSDTSVQAEESTSLFSVTPTSVYIDLQADTTKSGQLQITNHSTSTQTFRVSVIPYYVDSNYDIELNTENNHTQLSKWIKITGDSGVAQSITTVTIPAQETKDVPYSVIMPSNAEDARQYAMFVVAAVQSDDQAANVNISSQIGIQIYGKTDKAKTISSINSISAKSVLLSGNVAVKANITNSGDNAVMATEDIIVKSLSGTTLYESQKTEEIYPDTTHDIELAWQDTPTIGIMHLDYVVSAGEEQISDSCYVVKLPIAFVIAFIILLTIIVATIIKLVKAKNRKKSSDFTPVQGY